MTDKTVTITFTEEELGTVVAAVDETGRRGGFIDRKGAAKLMAKLLEIYSREFVEPIGLKEDADMDEFIKELEAMGMKVVVLK